MKRLIVLFAMVLFASIRSYAGIQIEMRTSGGNNGKETIKLSWQGTMLRIDQEEGGVIIKDAQMLILDAASMSYFSMPYDTSNAEGMEQEAQAMAEEMQSENGGTNASAPGGFRTWGSGFYRTAQFTKTGETRTIAGYACTEYKVVYKGATAYLYFTKDTALVAEARKLVEFSSFAAYMVSPDVYGVLLGVKEDGSMTFEVVSIKVQTLPASVFEPTGYTEINLFDMSQYEDQ